MIIEILKSPYTPTIAAIVAIIAAVVSPVLVALINQIGANMLKKKELFFDEKAKAYKNYIAITSTYKMSQQQSIDMLELHKANNIACLYSSKDTQAKLSLYSNLLINEPYNHKDIGQANYEAIFAMQKELKKL